MIGSITAKVLHDADQAFAPVIRGALQFSSLLNGTWTVVHAVPAADETSDNPGEKELRKYLFRAAEEKFAHLQREAQVDVRIFLAGGAVSTVVREAALRLNAKLVIIGRGHTQRSLGRLRTHSYSIIRNSPCPVLSI